MTAGGLTATTREHDGPSAGISDRLTGRILEGIEGRLREGHFRPADF